MKPPRIRTGKIKPGKKPTRTRKPTRPTRLSVARTNAIMVRMARGEG